MTLRLILTRHAKSDWSTAGQEDFDRPLAKRGQRDAPRVARWLVSRGYIPDQVQCSAAARTRETMEMILAEMAATPEIHLRDILYHAEPAVMLAELQKASGKTVLMVGHNPGIAAFAALLVHDRPAHPRFGDYPTAATAVIDFSTTDWSDIAPGRGAIRDFVTPHDLDPDRD